MIEDGRRVGVQLLRRKHDVERSMECLESDVRVVFLKKQTWCQLCPCGAGCLPLPSQVETRHERGHCLALGVRFCCYCSVMNLIGTQICKPNLNDRDD